MPETTDANARYDSVPPAASLPFFARFLEGQNREERSFGTLKYPSDRDEDIDPLLEAPTTDGNTLEAAPERRMTLKYPSDRDDIEPFDAPTTDGNTLQAAPERRMTLKYPSDRDEWWDSRDN